MPVVQPFEDLAIPVLLVIGEVVLESRQSIEESANGARVGASRIRAEALQVQVLRLEESVEPAHARKRQHRLLQVERLAHQRGPAAGDHGTTRREVVNEPGVVATFRGACVVDTGLDAGRTDRGEDLTVASCLDGDDDVRATPSS